MKCNTFFISSICYHLFILLLHFKFLSNHYFNGFCFRILLTFTFFSFKFSRVIIVSFARYSLKRLSLNLFIRCKTQKKEVKEGRAFRNNCEKYIYSQL